MQSEKNVMQQKDGKINKEYISLSIDPAIEPMIVAYFNENQNDQNIEEFMLTYIRENLGDRLSINESERLELDFLR